MLKTFRFYDLIVVKAILSIMNLLPLQQEKSFEYIYVL